MGKPIGVLLKEWREDSKLSVSVVARTAGVSRATVARWEAQKFAPCIPELEKVLDVLAVTPAQRMLALESIPRIRAVSATAQAMPGCDIGLNNLIKVMRIRRGIRQLDLAMQIGVTQSAIGQWEAGDSWPDSSHLSALLHALGARPEESVAMSSGPQNMAWQGADSIDGIAQGLKTLLRPTGFGMSDELLDLRALALDASVKRLCHGERTPGAAHELKGEIQAAYAQALLLNGRYREARDLCNRALQIPTGGKRLRYAQRATVIRADAIIKGVPGSVPMVLGDLSALAESIGSPRSFSEYSYRTWISSTLADGFAQLGDATMALRFFEQASEFSRQHEPPSLEPGRWHAKLLNRLELHGSAIAAAEDALSWPVNGHLDARRRPAIRLEWIRAAVALGNKTGARHQMNIAQAEIAELQISYLDAQCKELQSQVAWVN